MKLTIYSGYSVWPDGLSVWPSSRRKWRWSELAAIRTAFAAQGGAFVATLDFRSGKPITLHAQRVLSFGTGLGRFAELLAQAAAAAPDGARIDELTLEIAQWGPREVRKRLLSRAGLASGAAQHIEQARHHRVWLDNSRALKAVDAALAQDREHPEAHALKHRLHFEQGRTKQARTAAEQWVACRTADIKARAVLQQMRLADNESAAADEATKLLEQDPRNEALTTDLAAFHFRAGRFDEAAGVWRRFGAAVQNPEARQRAQEMAHYAERTGSDAGFRRKETVKHWGRLTLVWASVLVPVLFLLGSFYRQYTRAELQRDWREDNEQLVKEIVEKTKQHLAASESRLTDLTGRIPGDYASVRPRAEKGEAAAQFTLAEMLFDGNQGAPKDPEAGLYYLEKAAAQDHRAALLDLGQKLVAGKRVPRDPARAAGLFERAIARGSARAAAELAELYEKGDGVPEDGAKAFDLYARAADLGNVYAMTQAGWMLERGKGVPADPERALGYYRRAAEKKSEWATNRLVTVLTARADDPAAQSEAWAWIKRAAQQGSSAKRVLAAVMVLSGSRDDAEVAPQAGAWLTQAVAANELGAGTQLGQCLMNGWGMEQDFTRATELFARDEKNSEPARAFLARNLAFGVGCPRDLARAKDLLASLKDPAQRAWLERYLGAADGAANSGEAGAPFRDTPQYPIGLRRTRVEGEVRLSFSFNQEGFVERVRIISATRPEFAAAARLAVTFWRFKKDFPVGREVAQQLEFRVDEHDGHDNEKVRPD